MIMFNIVPIEVNERRCSIGLENAFLIGPVWEKGLKTQLPVFFWDRFFREKNLRLFACLAIVLPSFLSWYYGVFESIDYFWKYVETIVFKQ